MEKLIQNDPKIKVESKNAIIYKIGGNFRYKCIHFNNIFIEK